MCWICEAGLFLHSRIVHIHGFVVVVEVINSRFE